MSGLKELLTQRTNKTLKQNLIMDKAIILF